MNAKYTLIPIVRQPNINPGDPVEVDLYLSGYGTVENKLHIGYTDDRLISVDDPGEITFNVDIKFESGEPESPIAGKHTRSTHKLGTDSDTTHSVPTIMLNDGYFQEHPHWNAGNNYPENVDSPDIPLITSEVRTEGHPPLYIKLNTKQDVPSGDYQIPITFTYRKDSQIEQTKEQVKIHINTTRERLEPYPTYAGIATVAIALISLVYSTGFFGLVYGLIKFLLM